MPFGSLNITLRPLRLAFLVDPADKSGILEAIQLFFANAGRVEVLAFGAFGHGYFTCCA
jgi:hypothetical protein